MTSRPEIPRALTTLIHTAFERVRYKLQSSLLDHAKRAAAVDRLNAIKDAVLAGKGEIPYLSQLELTFKDGPAEEMRLIVELLEAIQALADWQINQPPGVDDRAVREFFLRVGRSSPWSTTAEIVFRDGNVSPEAQRLIRALGRFKTPVYGGQMVMITPLVDGLGAVITAVTLSGQTDTGRCPPQIRLDPMTQVWGVVPS